MTPEEFFTNKQQLDRYYYAVGLAKKLQKIQNNNFIIFDEYDDVIEGKIFYRENFNSSDWCVFGFKENDYTLIYIDIEYDSMGYPWIMSKKKIEKVFKLFKYLDPKHIKKFI